MKFYTMTFLYLFSLASYAQDYSALNDQKEIYPFNRINIQVNKSQNYSKTTQILKPLNILNPLEQIDTLSYQMPLNGNNFGLFGQDWIVQWFRASADLNILALGLYCTENQNQTPAEVKLVKLNWDYDSLLNAQVLVGVITRLTEMDLMI